MKRKIMLISIAQTATEPGLRSISSYLRQHGYEVHIIFLKMRFEKTIPQAVIEQVVRLSSGSVFIGISLMTHEFFIAKYLTQKLKEATAIPIVWGGAHPMSRPEECLNYCDFVCVGEGEITALQLADKICEGGNCAEIPNLWYNIDGIIKQNPVRPPIEDLDSLPFPDFSFENHYLLKNDKIGRIIGMDNQREILGTIYPQFSQRGCPYICTYCINHFFLRQFGRSFHRKRSVESIIAELVKIKSEFSFINFICFFADDFLSMNNEEIKQFAKLYRERINLPFHINVTPASVSEEKLSALVEIGLKEIAMGIQSGSQATLKLYKRFTTKEKILRAARILNNLHSSISISYDFILDNPWEKEENLLETLELLTEIRRPYKILLYSLTLYPGTELYDKAKDEGLVKDEIAEIYNKSYHTDISNGYLNSIFYLYSIYPLPRWLGRFLINRKVIHHPLYFLPYKIIGKGIIFLKGLHFVKYIFLAISQKNVQLLKIYWKVALREFKKIFSPKK